MFEMFEILRILVLLFFAIPVLVFGSYGLIILYYGKIRKPKETNKYWTQNTTLPFVSVVTPTHNEEHIIKKKLDNQIVSL